MDQIETVIQEIIKAKDGAYKERNQVVALLAKLFPSGTARTAIEGWSEDWHGCVYIDLPTGQASWHYHDSQAYLFAELPAYTKGWDGHTTEEKYERIAAVLPDVAGYVSEVDAEDRGCELTMDRWEQALTGPAPAPGVLGNARMELLFRQTEALQTESVRGKQELLNDLRHLLSVYGSITDEYDGQELRDKLRGIVGEYS